MTLAPGDTLGSYDIVASIGAGGMGEVFRAHDTRLNRDVALKVLPGAFAQDRERVARFRREAQLVASLNHPHIAAIYGIEESGSTLALILELVPGDDLAARLEHGSLPLEECLDIARQIAEGVEAAHEKGVIHRDLKPANIKVTGEGSVKILDFGLARALEGDATTTSDASFANSPTMARNMTAEGMILGTAAYMAPEQARGRSVDKRADIWSFGVVLYEMLTGRRLFWGETVSDVLASVLRQNVDLTVLPENTPLSVRSLLARCLERDPKRRLRDIGEARVILEEPYVSPAAAPVVIRAEHPSKRAAWIAAAVGWIGLLALGALYFGKDREASSTAAEAGRWAVAIPDGYTLSSAEFPQVAISEDGRLQAAVVVDQNAIPRILLRDKQEFVPRILPETERAHTPFFSPDGKWIAFYRDNLLMKIPLAGGPPVRLASVSGQTRGATWSRDGYLYFAPNTGEGLSRVAESGGAVTKVTTLDEAREERTHRWPAALPDGSGILFTCDTQASTEYYDDARIEILRPATGERKVLVEGSSQARHAPGGHLVFARGGSLYSVAFDEKTYTVEGTPSPVAQGVATDVGSGAVQFAISAHGDAVWAPGSASAAYTIAWIDRDAVETSVPIPPAPYNELSLSPDGKRVALVGGEGGVSDLWAADLERGTLTRLTIGEFIANPVWTSDGERVVYGTRSTTRKDNRWEIAWKFADGSREAEVLINGGHTFSPSDVTPDGRLLYSALADENNREDIYLMQLSSPYKPEPVLTGPFFKNDSALSPDGRYLAYLSDEGGRSNVYVRPFPSGPGRWQISTASGEEPRWSPDGREIFFRGDSTLFRVPVDTRNGFSAGRAERLFDRMGSGSAVHVYAVASDGKRILAFRSPEGRGAQRTLFMDPGFSRRLNGS